MTEDLDVTKLQVRSENQYTCAGAYAKGCAADSARACAKMQSRKIAAIIFCKMSDVS